MAYGYAKLKSNSACITLCAIGLSFFSVLLVSLSKLRFAASITEKKGAIPSFPIEIL